MRKFLTFFVLVPLAILIVVAAIANRQSVTVSLDPFLSGERAFSLTQPLFAILLAVLLIGLIVGGVAAWLRQGKWRQRARRAQAEIRSLQAEIEMLKQRLAASERTSPPRAIPSIGYRPPPAA